MQALSTDAVNETEDVQSLTFRTPIGVVDGGNRGGSIGTSRAQSLRVV